MLNVLYERSWNVIKMNHIILEGTKYKIYTLSVKISFNIYSHFKTESKLCIIFYI